MKWIILLALFWTFVLGESIVSINLNKAEGQIYALSTDSWLYELDNVAVFQNNKHFLNASAPPYGAGFIKKVYGHKYFFQTLYDINNYGVSLARIDLPFGNKLVLTTDETTRSYGYASVPTVFDNRDSIALSISNGDRLALFDLNSFQLTQSTKIIAGNKRAATAIVYNHKRNRAIVFWYRFLQSSRTYDMQVLEFNVTNSASFHQVASSFPDVGDFNNSKASNAEFDSSNNKIYILDSTSKRIVRFMANNLAVYRFISLGDVSFELGTPVVAYNFGSQLAYVLSDATTGFKLQEIDLVLGTVRRTRVYNTGLPVASALLDYQQGNLYVGLLDESTLPAKLLIIDLGNLNHELIPLNH